MKHWTLRSRETEFKFWALCRMVGPVHSPLLYFIKVRSYVAQCLVHRTAQSTLHFTSLADLFYLTLSQLLWEATSLMLQLMREGCWYSYPPLSIARYSFIQLSELEQCRVKNLPKDLTPQHRIQTRVLFVESAKLYP